MAPPSPSSSTSSPSPPLNFASLPITAIREKIVEKIMENRVTLIVGETSCGNLRECYGFTTELKLIVCMRFGYLVAVAAYLNATLVPNFLFHSI